MHFVAHDLQRPKQIAGASQTQEKHRGAAVSRHAFSISSTSPLYWDWKAGGRGYGRAGGGAGGRWGGRAGGIARITVTAVIDL